MSEAASVSRTIRSGTLPAALSARRQSLAARLLELTASIVECTGAGEWQRLPQFITERRALLARLKVGPPTAAEARCLEALHQAVIESDHTVGLILASAAPWLSLYD
jgi:hypothetical protein